MNTTHHHDERRWLSGEEAVVGGGRGLGGADRRPCVGTFRGGTPWNQRFLGQHDPADAEHGGPSSAPTPRQARLRPAHSDGGHPRPDGYAGGSPRDPSTTCTSTLAAASAPSYDGTCLCPSTSQADRAPAAAKHASAQHRPLGTIPVPPPRPAAAQRPTDHPHEHARSSQQHEPAPISSLRVSEPVCRSDGLRRPQAGPRLATGSARSSP